MHHKLLGLDQLPLKAAGCCRNVEPKGQFLRGPMTKVELFYGDYGGILATSASMMSLSTSKAETPHPEHASPVRTGLPELQEGA